MVDWSVLSWGVVGGLVVVALTAAGTATAVSREGPSRTPDGREKRPGTRALRGLLADSTAPTLPGGAAWRFADSWATNLTALITTGAAVAAIFSKDLDALFVGKAPLAFSLTTAILLVVAALAPVAYTVLQVLPPPPEATPDDGQAEVAAAEGHGARNLSGQGVAAEDASPEDAPGTMLGWCASAALTLFAVGGSLTAAMRVSLDVVGHGAGAAVACVVLVLVIALVGLYVGRSFLTVLRATRSGGATPPASLVGFVSVSCCSGSDRPAVVRISLL